jgi:type II secretory pathway component GspD/PulD (secretin)
MKTALAMAVLLWACGATFAQEAQKQPPPPPPPQKAEEPKKPDPAPPKPAEAAPQQKPPAPPAPPKADPPAKPAEEPVPKWQEFCCFEKGRVERDGLVTVIFELSHVPQAAAAGIPSHELQGIEEYQKMLLPHVTPGKGRIEVSNRLNSLALTDTKENIRHVERILHLIHSPSAPIMIEAKVVELRWDKEIQIGMQGDINPQAGLWVQHAGSEAFLKEIRAQFNPTAALTTPFQGSTFRFQSTSAHRGTISGIIQAFVEQGQAQILSQPRILVRADKTATIFAGEEVPTPTGWQVQPAGTFTSFAYKQAGIKLEVSPRIASPGQVAMRFKPDVTTTFGYVQVASGVQAPQFTVRNAQTDLLVRSGQEVVIGGLYRKEKSTIRRGLPFVSDIPILGYLFGKYEDYDIIQEVIFFIKPTVILSEADLPVEPTRPDFNR